ncbi:MAG: ATP-binding protein [Candidatus Woesearchaeota archaeon]
MTGDGRKGSSGEGEDVSIDGSDEEPVLGEDPSLGEDMDNASDSDSDSEDAEEEIGFSYAWEEEKKAMLDVINTQGEVIQELKKKTDVMHNVIGKQREQKEELEKRVDEFAKKLQHYAQPVADLEGQFNVCKEDVKFSDIGGLAGVLEKVRDFQHGMMYPKMFEVYAIEPPRGLLVHGPPGCGKTMLGKAISNELGAYFLEVPVTSFISKWVGEAEKTLEMMLKKCQEVYVEKGNKVVVFMDEAEQVFGNRGVQGDGVMDRCKQVWLRYMDGMAEAGGIIFVAATNRLDIIDPAIRRAGRFDYVVEIPHPDRKGVEEILRKQVEWRARRAGRQVYTIDDYTRIADRMYSKGMCGADIAEVLKRTAREQISYFIDTLPPEQMISPDEVQIFQHQIEAAVDKYDPGERQQNKRKIGFTSYDDSRAAGAVMALSTGNNAKGGV